MALFVDYRLGAHFSAFTLAAVLCRLGAVAEVGETAFSIGDRVRVKDSDGLFPGKSGFIRNVEKSQTPYSVQLDSGASIWFPEAAITKDMPKANAFLSATASRESASQASQEDPLEQALVERGIVGNVDYNEAPVSCWGDVRACCANGTVQCRGDGVAGKSDMQCLGMRAETVSEGCRRDVQGSLAIVCQVAAAKFCDVQAEGKLRNCLSYWIQELQSPCRETVEIAQGSHSPKAAPTVAHAAVADLTARAASLAAAISDVDADSDFEAALAQFDEAEAKKSVEMLSNQQEDQDRARRATTVADAIEEAKAEQGSTSTAKWVHGAFFVFLAAAVVVVTLGHARQRHCAQPKHGLTQGADVPNYGSGEDAAALQAFAL